MTKNGGNGQNVKNGQIGSQKCHAPNFFHKKSQKYFEWRAKTVKNEFPTHESTYPYVFSFFLERFWPNKKKVERDKSVT